MPAMLQIADLEFGFASCRFEAYCHEEKMQWDIEFEADSHPNGRFYDYRPHLVCKLVRCPKQSCPNHRRTFAPEAEMALTLPRWMIGWDVPQIRAELMDGYQIPLSEDAIEDYLQRYQCMLAARQQDFLRLRQEYRHTPSLMLSIDGLQPEKGVRRNAFDATGQMY